MRSEISHFFRSRILWSTVACFGLYWVLAIFPAKQSFFETTRILQATTALIVTVAFGRAVIDAVTTPTPDRIDVLALAVALGQFSLVATGIWLLLWRLAGQPEWMLNTYWFTFFSAWLSSLSSILFVTAPGVLHGTDGEDVPPMRLILVGCVAGLGLMATLIVLAAQPDVRGLTEAIRPYVH